jgi:hypothetical protein
VDLLLDNSLNAIQSHLQRLHLGSITESDEVMTRTIEEITSLTWVQVEENTRDNDDSLLKTCLEEIESIRDGSWETLEIKPEVECGIGNGLDMETHTTETFNDIVSLVTEMTLESLHFCENLVGLEHGDGGFLERNVSSSIEVRTARSDGFDEFLFPVN